MLSESKNKLKGNPENCGKTTSKKFAILMYQYLEKWGNWPTPHYQN